MSDVDLGILSACQFVSENSRSVQLDKTRLEQLAKEWVDHPFEVPGWDLDIHWQGETGATIHYILLLDALNFCFWPDPGQERWRVEHRGQTYNGYKALAVALGRALDEGFPLTSAAALAELSMDQLEYLLRGQNQIPMLPQRLQHAREVGQQLLKLYGGDFRNAIEKAGGSAQALTHLIARDFPCFYDVSHYRGREIPIYKRAQITVVDLAGSLEFKDYGEFFDLDRLTAFADYKIPQVLRAFGVLVYAPDLAQRLDNYQQLAPGCEEEVEIRAGMVWAVELIRQRMAELGRDLKAYEVDWFLWNLGQAPLPEERPYHRTRTVFY